MSYCTKLFVIWRKLRRANQTLNGHFAPNKGGSDKLKACLFFIYISCGIYDNKKSLQKLDIFLLKVVKCLK